MERVEPDLIDYLAVLWRWRWLVVIGAVVGVALAGIVTWGRPPTGQLVATIDGGSVTDGEVERLVAMINYGTFRDGQETLWPARRVGAEFRRPFVIRLTLDGGSPAVDVPILARTAERVVEALMRVLRVQQGYDEAGQQGYDEAELQSLRSEIARQESLKRVLEDRVQALRRTIDLLRKARSDALSRASDPSTALVLIHLLEAIETRESALAEAERQVATDIPQLLISLNSRAGIISRKLAAARQPRLVVDPETQPLSASRVKLNLAVGFVAGVLGSVLLALFAEYVGDRTRRARAAT